MSGAADDAVGGAVVIDCTIGHSPSDTVVLIIPFVPRRSMHAGFRHAVPELWRNCVLIADRLLWRRFLRLRGRFCHDRVTGHRAAAREARASSSLQAFAAPPRRRSRYRLRAPA